MAKKVSRKLLSIILTIAICCTTVLGCLMTVSAATDGTYAFDTAVVNADATQATVNLTIQLSAGKFTAGMFTLNEVDYDADDHLTLVSASAEGDVSVTADTEELTDGAIANVVVDAPADGSKEYSSVTIALTFGFSNGQADGAKEYQIGVSDFEFAYSASAYYTNFTGSNGVISAGCDHVITVTGDPIKVDVENGVSVYENSVCSICGESFGYQVVPTQVPGKVVYWSGEFTAPTNTDASGTYIISTAEELAYIAQNATTGNYKVADGIEAFIMQPEGVVDADEIMSLSSYTETKAYFEKLVADGADVKSWANSLRDSGKVFDGKFDGNGVSVYGMYCLGIYQGTPSGDYRQSSALFPLVSQATVISNVSVNNSYFVTGGFAGSIVGYVLGSADGMVNLEKCIVANCYVMSSVLSNANASVYNQAGVVFGSIPYSAYKTCLSMQNCLVYGSYAGHIDGHAEGLWGNTNTGYNGQNTEYPNITVKNCIILDCVPYSIGGSNQSLRAEYFSNVYASVLDPRPALIGTWNYTWDSYITAKNSDGTSRIIEISAADVKGANAQTTCSNLDWENIWTASKNGYPLLNAEVNTIDTELKVVYTVYAGTSEVDANGWPDGRFMDVEGGTNNGTGTKDDPFILSTPGHLRYLVQKSTYATTNGKYFAIDPTIDVMCLQYEYRINNAGGIDALLALDDVDDVEAYYKSNTFDVWQGNPSAAQDTFAGHFDGNGVIITGMNTTSKGLFGGVNDGATITNLTLKNNYIASSNDAGAALIGEFYPSKTYLGTNRNNTNCTGTLVLDNIVLANNSISANKYGAVMIGYWRQYVNVKMSNCLVYGNVSTNTTDGNAGGLFGEVAAWHSGDEAGNPNGEFKNSIILDCVPYANHTVGQATKPAYYTNIYTNTAMAYKPCSHNTSDATYLEDYAGKIIQINTNDILGLAAKDELALDFENTWALDYSGGYPTLKMPGDSVINDISSSSLNLKAVNLTYNNDGSFNINFYYTPAMANFAPELIVAKSDLSKFMTLDGTVLSDSEASALGVKSGTIRYTIDRLSAREIADTMLPTVITANAGTAVWGKSEQISIKDYATAIIGGSYSQADKNVAAAVINYGDAAKAALSTGYDYVEGEKRVVYAVAEGTSNVDAYNYPDGRFMDVEGGTNVGTGTKDDPFIISTPGHIRYLGQFSTYETTNGKYFAIDPTIDVMCLQYEGTMNKLGGVDALLALDDVDDVQAFYETNASSLLGWQANSSTGEYFGGHLDGNGVTIVGMYTTTSFGLISSVSENASVENITVKNCYVKSPDYAGPIFGYARCSTEYTATGLSNSNCPGVVSLEKCTVYNNYIASTGNNQRVGALMGGAATYIGVKMNECLVYGNAVVGLKDAANPVDMNCLFGFLSTGHNGDTAGYYNGSYKNSIILDCVPYASYQSNQAYKCFYYENVYTNMPRTDYTPSAAGAFGSYPASSDWASYDGRIINLDSADMVKGSAAAANMPELDWDTTWIYGLPGEYPSLAENVIETESAGEIWYWDGTTEVIDTTSHAGTADDPYIIENAQQLNMLCMKTGVADSTGKYYKIADGVAAIVLQSSGAEEIMALDSAAVTKAYFESITPTNWLKNFSWKQFNGNFDGNNVPIYGLYASRSDTMVGMFPEIDGGGDGTGVSGSPSTDNVGITFKNIVIRNAYITTTATDKRVGVVVGHSYGSNHGACTNGTVNFDKIEVSNSYVYNPNTHKSSAGILGANFDVEIVHATNLLIYGNDTLTGNGVAYPVFGSAHGSRKDAEDNIIHNTVENSIVLGANPYNLYDFSYRQSTADNFEKVYTDAPVGTVTFKVNDSLGVPYTTTYATTDMKAITAADIIGEGVMTACPDLDWNTESNTDGIWYAGNAWDVVGFEAPGIMPNITQNAYDALTLTNYDEYGETNPEFSMYATSLNLKTNPYIAFTFAFNKEYKADRDNITVTFTTASGTITTTVGDGNGGVSAGWTNNKAAGRYHLYRLEGISVEDMCKDIKVTVNYDGTDYNFGTFSVEGFALDLINANKKAPCDYYATRAEAAKALLFYTKMVNDRYGAQ